MSRKIVQIALLVAAASILFTVETYIPTPFPWMRLGLANGVTLLALRWWGMREALALVLLRVVVGSLLLGRLFHPVFILSLSGGVAACLVMGVLMRFGSRVFSLIGVSVAGAVAKNLIQLLMAYLVFVTHSQILFLLPMFLLSSLVSGILVGFISLFLSLKFNPAQISGVSVRH